MLVITESNDNNLLLDIYFIIGKYIQSKFISTKHQKKNFDLSLLILSFLQMYTSFLIF